MKQFVGTAFCDSQEQIVEAIEVLKRIHGVEVCHSGLELEAVYTPDDRASWTEETRTVAQIMDAIEGITEHSFCMIP